MPKTKEEKKKTIEGLEKKLTSHKAIVLVDFKEVNSKSLFDLRNTLKEANCLFEVVKKNLLRKALERLNKKELAERIKGIKAQLALAFGFDDEIALSKICYQGSKENDKIKIVGGVLGEEFLDREKVLEFAQLPSREELLGRLTWALKSPISKFSYVLENNIKGLINIFKAMSNK